MSFVVAAFYKFISLPDYTNFQKPLQDLAHRWNLKGIILLAEEGINSTLSGTREGVDALLAFLKADLRFTNLPHKESYAETQPFYRMKVRLKKEIVTLGVDGINPREKVGTYVKPQNWNQLISDPDVILIDTRNDYEVEIGKFKGAINPLTSSFREFPDFVEKNLPGKMDKKIALFCTGGIRCEKATSYMLEKGFKEVYHLEGGILKYLEEVSPEQSLWEGECFVFDHRVAVNHSLQAGEYDLCYGCRKPLSAEEKVDPRYQKGVTCPTCHNTTTDQQKIRFQERQKQIELAQQRHQNHLGS